MFNLPLNLGQMRRKTMPWALLQDKGYYHLPSMPVIAGLRETLISMMNGPPPNDFSTASNGEIASVIIKLAQPVISIGQIRYEVKNNIVRAAILWLSRG